MKLIKQSKEVESAERRDAYGNELDMFYPDVLVKTFFKGENGEKIAFEATAGRVSSLGPALEVSAAGQGLAIVGPQLITAMALSIVTDGHEMAVVRRCPLSLPQRLAGHGLHTTSQVCEKDVEL